jgi:hypothetical protein
MPIDLDDIFTRGGKPLIDVLNYCVRSVQMDPVFAFLVEEYRLSPTQTKAVALYDIFAAPGAPARINAADLLPPRELALQIVIENLRRSQPGPASIPHGGTAPRLQAPPGKHIFDALALHVRKNRRGAIARIKRRYNLKLTPTENLPGRRMTSGQRNFVDQVWQPRIRPALLTAGFRRIANIA